MPDFVSALVFDIVVLVQQWVDRRKTFIVVVAIVQPVLLQDLLRKFVGFLLREIRCSEALVTLSAKHPYAQALAT